MCLGMVMLFLLQDYTTMAREMGDANLEIPLSTFRSPYSHLYSQLRLTDFGGVSLIQSEKCTDPEAACSSSHG